MLEVMRVIIGTLASGNGDVRDHNVNNSGSGGTTSVFRGGIGNITGPPTLSKSTPKMSSLLSELTTTLIEMGDTSVPVPSPDERTG